MAPTAELPKKTKSHSMQPKSQTKHKPQARTRNQSQTQLRVPQSRAQSKPLHPPPTLINFIEGFTKKSEHIGWSTTPRISGGTLSSYPVAFTQDSNYFFLISSNTVKLYSTRTGAPISTLTTHTGPAHDNAITCLHINPRNPLQLYTGGLDGRISLWDFNDSVLLRQWNIGMPITHMVIHKKHPNAIYIIVEKSSNEAPKTNSILFRFDLTASLLESESDKGEENIKMKANGKDEEKKKKKEKNKKKNIVEEQKNEENNGDDNQAIQEKQLKIVRLLKIRECAGLCISSDGNYLVVAGRYKLHVWKIEHEKKREIIFTTYASQTRITCVAFHPTRLCIATGDIGGRITLWYCFNATNPDKPLSEPVTSVTHWHSHKINDLTFTIDGAYLLSGGEEAVLVIWQFETGHKQFLPRLGADILNITVSPDFASFALGLADNSVRIIDTTSLNLRLAVQGIKHSLLPASKRHSDAAKPSITSFLAVPGAVNAGHLVMTGPPGTLQFYNPVTDSQVLELEVCLRNRVSRTDEKELPQPKVDLVAFYGDGSWMATVDSRNDGETAPEQYLKFWAFDPTGETTRWELNTRVDLPHAGNITGLAFHPPRKAHPITAVTISEDGVFKLWQLVELTTVGARTSNIDTKASIERDWTCRSTGTYRGYPARAVCFSADGSVLAIAFGRLITLWDPYTGSLSEVLCSANPSMGTVQLLEFCGSSPYLIAVYESQLEVWDLLSCTLSWSMHSTRIKIAVDHIYTRFIVTSEDWKNSEEDKGRDVQTHMAIFDPHSHIPVATLSAQGRCQALVCLPLNSEKLMAEEAKTSLSGRLVVLNDQWDLAVFGDPVIDEEPRSSPTEVPQLQKPTFFLDVFGKDTVTTARYRQTREESEFDQKYTQPKRSTGIEVFDAPSHLLPPVAMIYEAFMDGLLEKAPGVKIDEGKDDDENDESDIKKAAMDNEEERKDIQFEPPDINGAMTSANVITENMDMDTESIKLPILSAYFMEQLKLPESSAPTIEVTKGQRDVNREGGKTIAEEVNIGEKRRK